MTPIIGEVGIISIPPYMNSLQNPKRIYFGKEGGYADPVVIASPLHSDENDDNRRLAVISNNYGNCFDIYKWGIDDWDGEGSEGNEEICYLAMESGQMTFDDGTKIYVGKTWASWWWQYPQSKVQFPENFFSTPPIVFAQGQSTERRKSEDHTPYTYKFPFTTYIRGITSDGFQVAKTGGGEGRIGFIAISPGKGTGEIGWTDGELYTTKPEIGNWGIDYLLTTIKNLNGGKTAKVPLTFEDDSKSFEDPVFIATYDTSNSLKEKPEDVPYDMLTYKDNTRVSIMRYSETDNTKYIYSEGSINYLNDDECKNYEHVTEDITYWAFDQSQFEQFTPDRKVGYIGGVIPVGEAGTVDFSEGKEDSDRFIRKDLDYTYNNVPVIIAKPLHYSDANGISAHIRIKNVKYNSFEMKREWWKGRGGTVTDDDVDYIALVPGNYILKNGEKVEVGRIDSITDKVSGREKVLKTFLPGFFDTEGEDVIVMAQSQTYNDDDPIVTRLREVTPQGFQAVIEGQKSVHNTETIGYVAIQLTSEEGGGTTVMNGQKYKFTHHPNKVGTISDGDWEKINLVELDTGSPLLIAALQTWGFGPRPVDLRCQPWGTVMKVGIDDDISAWPSKERFAYLAFEGPCRIFADKVCSDPTNPDTDGDGLGDLLEYDWGMYLANADSDGDGLSDEFEKNVIYTCGYDYDGDDIIEYQTDPHIRDTDDDGIWDGDEVFGVVRGVGHSGKRIN